MTYSVFCVVILLKIQLENTMRLLKELELLRLFFCAYLLMLTRKKPEPLRKETIFPLFIILAWVLGLSRIALMFIIF